MNIVAFSGGKDSTAMLLRMIELNIPVDKIIFADTTLEYPDNYDYIRAIEKHIGKKITIVRPKTSFYEWFYGLVTRGKNEGMMRGMPLTAFGGYCCRELKIKPQQEIYDNKEDLVFLGIAFDEQERMLKGDNYRYPLIEWKWTEQKCREYLKEKGLLNPLYKKGWKRLGCWLCPKQSKESLRLLYENYPKHWKCLKKLERDSPNGFSVNWKLEELENQWKYQTKLVSVQLGDKK